ncbi:MAG: hypothetical protein SVW57_10640 [Thermodesulfobacteriota bacterium]|nr:hypothetical protein [Thermodesulfobacteriota bacterium]
MNKRLVNQYNIVNILYSMWYLIATIESEIMEKSNEFAAKF